MLSLGLFLTACSAFETTIDIGLMKELGISSRHAEILTSSLNYKAKSTALCSLLQEKPEIAAQVIPLIQKYDSTAKRNAIIHSHVFVDPTKNTISFSSGRASVKYRATLHTFTAAELNEHARLVSGLGEEIQKILEIPEDLYHQFTAIRFAEAIT